MKRLLLAIMVVLGLGIYGSGAESVVEVKPIAPSAPLKAGQPSVLTLELKIREQFHINSDKPLEDFLIPTTVAFKEQPGVKFGKPVFPQAPLKKLPVAEKPMSVYEGTVTLTAEITPEPGFKAKEVVVDGTVRYQACNNKTCLPPNRAPFSLTLAVAEGTVSTSSVVTNADQQSVAGSSETAPADAQTDRRAEIQAGSASVAAVAPVTKPAEQSDYDKSLLGIFLMVFLGGLSLNLTPCVYPMIPITISYFGGQSQGKKGTLFLHSSLYVIGMATTYSILGSIAALTGSLFGSALQHPPVLIGIAAIMVLLALSMFDVYELQMPGFMNRLAASSHNGFFGTFFMGLTVGIVAAPCIGPFVLGLLTYVGNKGNPVLGFAMFFTLALGLGVPFLFLGVFSGSIGKLPRSGGWMIWVRTIFGFVLLGMAIYFLRPLFPNELLFHLTFALTMLLGGIYMAWVEPTQGKGKGFLYVRNAVGLVFFAAALYLTFNGIQAHVDETVAKKLETLSSVQGSNVAIRWAPYSEDKLAQATREGKPIFIDFYADWCLPCKALDRNVFADSDVIAASKDFVMLKGDQTSAEDPKTAEIAAKYQVKGVPTLVFLRPDGVELAELRGTEFETKETFLAKMKQALQQSAPKP